MAWFDLEMKAALRTITIDTFATTKQNQLRLNIDQYQIKNLDIALIIPRLGLPSWSSQLPSDAAKVSLSNQAHNDGQEEAKLRLDDMDAPQDVKGDVTKRSPSPNRNAAEERKPSEGTLNRLKSPPPTSSHGDAMDVDLPNNALENSAGKSDSEAETIVLPGKDGHSPSKVRKTIKHEDKSDDETVKSPRSRRASVNGETSARISKKSNELATATSTLGKRKRQRSQDNHGNSSGLSSVPTSPVATTRSSLSKRAGSDSEISKSPSPGPRSTIRDKAKSVDHTLPRTKRFDLDSGEEDDIEERKSSRQRISGSKSEGKLRKGSRSVSPHHRNHRRSISTQLPAKSSSGLSHKKKRVPAPLQSTEYHSDDSSASGSSHPRSSRLRSLAAPHTGESTMSPLKTASHKKHVNSSGQTQLQRACASNKSDQLVQVMQRYEERPQDLNESDHAGNTPLHSASINGYVKVVKFLLGTGHCIVDPLNIQKDTPLHDSLENRHVDVVKLLLNAGADPRKPKGDGKDPLDIITEKMDDDEDDEELLAEWQEMKTLITAAIKKQKHNRQDSEDDRHEPPERGLSHATESPRHTPPVHSSEFPTTQAGTRRVGVGTSRQVKTKDGNLYQPMNLTELRKAARDGDNDTTARILEVMPNTNDPTTLWLSARGGHSDTMEFQLAMGKFDPDPGPLEDGAEPGKDTPFLVAIGRGNHLNVLKLLLAHGVDPTRKHDGDTYYEIARKRKGPNWQEEVAILKEAFDTFKKSSKSSPSKPRSPGLRRDQRDAERDRRGQRKEEPVRTHKRSSSDPKPKDSVNKPSHRRNSSSADHSKDHHQIKRGPGRPRKDEAMSNVAVSDRESSPLAPPKAKSQSRKSESELTLTSDNEAVAKPRRKLVSGKEFRGERDVEKQRRASVVSNASTASAKEKRDRIEAKADKAEGKASSNVPKNAVKAGDGEPTLDKHYLDKERARSLKRDDSKDRLSAIRGESPAKRPRMSETPPRANDQDSTGNVSKRRKIESDSGRNPESTPGSSPEHHTKQRSNLSRDSSTVRGQTDSEKQGRAVGDFSKEGRRSGAPLSTSQLNSAKTSPTEGQESKKPSKSSHGPASEKETTGAAGRAKDDDVKEAQSRREKEELETLRQKAEEERKEAARAEEAKQARLAREQAAKKEEALREKEEAERRERQRLEEVEARNRAAEAQRAAYLEQERIKREEQEKRRALAQEQARAEKARLEKLKREEHLAKLPYLLRWLELIDEPKTVEIGSLFKSIPGYRYDTIKPEMTGDPNGREPWMLNTQVALLLGERDLQLSRYTAWERIPLTMPMKQGVWSTQNDWFTLRNFSLPRTLRNYFPSQGLAAYTLVEQNKTLFLDLDIFFVKVSEFMFVVPSFPHLRGIEMEVKYMELMLPLSTPGPLPPAKWRSDPDVDPDQFFAPRSKFFLNGEISRLGQITKTRLLTEPPPGDDRVPRRGLVRAYPGEPDYEEICKSQGLLQFLPSNQISPVSSTNPQLGDLDNRPPQVNGFTPPGSDVARSINGGSPVRNTVSEPPPPPTNTQLPNGTSEHDESPTDPATISSSI